MLLLFASVPLFFGGRAIWRSLRDWRPLAPMLYEPGVKPMQRETVLHPYWKSGLALLALCILTKYAISAIAGH